MFIISTYMKIKLIDKYDPGNCYYYTKKQKCISSPNFQSCVQSKRQSNAEFSMEKRDWIFILSRVSQAAYFCLYSFTGTMPANRVQ